MTISKVIEALNKIRVKCGDIEVGFDCPRCGHIVEAAHVEVGPPIAKIRATLPEKS